MKSNPYKRKKYKYSSSPLSVGIPQKRKKHLFGITRKDPSVYLDSYKTPNRFPWLIPSLMVLALLTVVFWTGPMLLRHVSEYLYNRGENEDEISLLYDSENFAVAYKQVVDVYREPDLRSARITQLLYNDVVRIIDRKHYGFLSIRLGEDRTGYVMERDVSFSTSHVEPSLFRHKIVITARSKRIMSHASRGSLLAEVPMGTVLFSDYQGGNVYRVALADGLYGWISASGMIRMDPFGQPEKSTAEKFYETALYFNHARHIEGGISVQGASSEGIVYICAYVNGLTIPRDREGQIRAGTQVPVLRSDSLIPDYDLMQRGDIIFFGEKGEDGTLIREMGIVVGRGQVLMSMKSQSSVRMIRLDDYPGLAEKVIAVRRLF